MILQVFQLLEYGNANRRQSPTEANATSSRSHAVLQVRIVKSTSTPCIFAYFLDRFSSVKKTVLLMYVRQ